MAGPGSLSSGMTDQSVSRMSPHRMAEASAIASWSTLERRFTQHQMLTSLVDNTQVPELFWVIVATDGPGTKSRDILLAPLLGLWLLTSCVLRQTFGFWPCGSPLRPVPVR